MPLQATATRSKAKAARRTITAAILTKVNAPLTIADDVVMPELAPGQVLVKMRASGICGKQIDEITGRRPDAFIPHLLGHEGAGVVEAIGPGVRKVKPGDHVVLHWMKGSGIDSVTPSFQRNGTTINAGWVTTFSTYTIVSENRATPLPADVPFDVACLLGCAVTTGLGIVMNNASLKPGQSIAVFGVGGVGLNVIHGAALVNAHPIVAVDLYDAKLKQAETFGATHTVNASQPKAAARLKELGGVRGFDAVVDVTGIATVRRQAYDLTSNTGITIFAGVPFHQEEFAIDSFPLHFGRRVIGSHGGETRPDVDIPRYLQLYALGKLKLKEQITHRFPLAQINTALEVVRKGEAGRCVIQMD